MVHPATPPRRTEDEAVLDWNTRRPEATPANSPADLLPPAEIIESAERVKVWMEINGYRNWQLGGICDRRFADRTLTNSR
jgi:hypothetical protein